MKKKCVLLLFSIICILTLTSCYTWTYESIINSPYFIGVGEATIEVGTPFDPYEGLRVRDEEDGEIDVSKVEIISKFLNVNKPGLYYVTYVAYDSDGHRSIYRRKVNVVDSSTE